MRPTGYWETEGSNDAFHNSSREENINLNQS